MAASENAIPGNYQSYLVVGNSFTDLSSQARTRINIFVGIAAIAVTTAIAVATIVAVVLSIYFITIPGMVAVVAVFSLPFLAFLIQSPALFFVIIVIIGIPTIIATFGGTLVFILGVMGIGIFYELATGKPL